MDTQPHKHQAYSRRKILHLGQSILAVGTPLTLLNMIAPAMAQTGTQNEWRFCTKCHAMFYNGYAISQNQPNDTGRCPAGGSHLPQGWEFFVDYDSSLHNAPIPQPSKQYDWRFCNKCFSLFWAGDRSVTDRQGRPLKKGICPAGGAHQDQGFMFGLYYTTNTRTSPRQPSGAYQSDWRFCVNCYALFFNGSGYGGGRCPGPTGQHVAAGYDFWIAFKDIPPKNGPGSSPGPVALSLNAKIVDYAVKHLGQCVTNTNGGTQPGTCAEPPSGIGPGECTYLVHSALVASGGRPPNYNVAPIQVGNLKGFPYIWGTRVGPPYQPGDIIQLALASFQGPNGSWSTDSQHTAIIQAVQPGNDLKVLQQHSPNRTVTQGEINLGWTLVRGQYAVYRPIPA